MLRLLAESPVPTSRAAVATASGLTRATVSAATLGAAAATHGAANAVIRSVRDDPAAWLRRTGRF